jgi:hypothetical protein
MVMKHEAINIEDTLQMLESKNKITLKEINQRHLKTEIAYSWQIKKLDKTREIRYGDYVVLRVQAVKKENLFIGSITQSSEKARVLQADDERYQVLQILPEADSKFHNKVRKISKKS